MGDELSANPDDARCWLCGYLLRGVASGRCPECGRAFDLSDPKSVNFGRPMGRVGRWMLGDLGWSGVVIAFVGCAAILCTTRWPVEGWRFSMVDLRYYARAWEWRWRGVAMTLTDGAYTIGLTVCAVVAAWRMLRLVCRGFAVRRYWPPGFQRGRWGRSTIGMGLMLVIALVGVGAGWPYRLGQRWIATVLNTPPPTPPAAFGWPGAAPVPRVLPLNLTADVRAVVLRSAVRQGRTARERVAAVKWLVEEQSMAEFQPILLDAEPGERDAEVRALETRLLGMCRKSQSIPTLLSLTKDGDANVRAAAADALGIWHSPIWPLEPSEPTGIRLDTDPPITFPSHQITRNWGIDSQIEVRPVLEQMMLQGSTSSEREAAARGLVNWPVATTHFRYAEWGVFQADPFGRTVSRFPDCLNEIPALAHRIPDLDAELDRRVTFDPSMPVWKPVIHLSADAPLAVDIQVSLARGRPWVAYPMFDDLAVVRRRRIEGDPSPPPSVHPKNMAKDARILNDLREGYPWLQPQRRTYPWVRPTGQSVLIPPGRVIPPGAGDLVIESAGIHWQSVIVSPKRLPWMTLTDVGTDPQFDWWKRLRAVDCSWVSSRGESERFLYYDGPVGRWAPVRAEISGNRLSIVHQVTSEQDKGGGRQREGFYIAVMANGVAMQWATDTNWAQHIDLATLSVGTSAAAEAEFARALQREGLTRSEADGLVVCWRKAFFLTPGRRYLHLMSAMDYDDLCPLIVRPTPTERVRVGVLWTEFPRE
jgi:hypothetical protein